MGNGEKDGKSVLLELVTKAKAWSALADLRNSTPNRRRVIATNVFMEACAHHDDENALQWFTWLLQAIVEEGDPNPEPAEATDWKADKEAKARLICRQADATKALYLELPRFRPESMYGDGSGEVSKRPTLLKTKKAMLEAIADGWKSASIDKDGDEFFMFIYKIDSGLHDGLDGLGDRELINETMKKITGLRFPLARLVYTLREHPDIYAYFLSYGWVKNCFYYPTDYGSKIGHILGAVGDFYGASPAATKFLGHISAKIIAVDRQLNSLNESPAMMFGPPKLEFVRDKANPKLDEVLACFKVVVFEEKDFHQRFEAVRDRIIEAKKGWSVLIRIKLRGEFEVRYSSQVTHPRTEDI